MFNIPHVENRATLELQKKEVISKLLKVWLDNPYLRLGQLIVNATSNEHIGFHDLFNVEDYILVDLLNQFNEINSEVIHPQITIEIVK